MRSLVSREDTVMMAEESFVGVRTTTFRRKQTRDSVPKDENDLSVSMGFQPGVLQFPYGRLLLLLLVCEPSVFNVDFRLFRFRCRR